MLCHVPSRHLHELVPFGELGHPRPPALNQARDLTNAPADQPENEGHVALAWGGGGGEGKERGVARDLPFIDRGHHRMTTVQQSAIDDCCCCLEFCPTFIV